MKKIMSFWLLMGAIFTARSQFTIKSKLMDSVSRQPVAYATISVYKPSNMQKPVLNTISAEDGSFQIHLNEKENFLVVILHTAYQEVRFSSPVSPIIFLLPKIKNIASITVTAKKPLIEKNEDKIIFNVEADASMDGQSALDALRKTPFISVDVEGNIRLKGQGDFKVLLNGKETALFAKEPGEALKAFPAAIIKKIEVITNPSAKYDAEGVGGIINIITRKRITGFNTAIVVSGTSLNAFNGNLTTNIKYGKLGIAGNFSASSNHIPPTHTITTTEALQPVVYNKRILYGDFYNYRNRRFGEIEISYDFDSLNIISSYSNYLANYGYIYNVRTAKSISNNYYDTSRGQLYDTSKVNYPIANIGLDYIHKFKGNAEKELAIKLNYEYSLDESLVNSDELYQTYSRFTINYNYAKNRQYTVQTDLVLPFSGKQKVETGLKAIIRNASADYESLNSYNNNDNFKPDVSNSDQFNYRQYVYSAYATYGFVIKKQVIRIGSRLEYTMVNGDFITSASVVKQHYTNFFPYLYLSRKLSKQEDISFSYSKRLRRPYIWDLNPFVFNTDSLNIRRGNENLEADITHSFEIGYSFFSGSTSLSLRLSENYCNNQITRYSLFHSSTGVTEVFPDNIGSNLFTGLNGTISAKLLRSWIVGLNTGVQYNIIKNTAKHEQRNTGFSGYLNLNNTVDFNSQLTGYANFGWTQSPTLLQGKYASNISYSFMTGYKMFKGKLRFTVALNNPFSKYLSYKNTLKDIGFIRTAHSNYPSRSAGISIRWSFGKLTESVSRKRGIKNDDLKQE